MVSVHRESRHERYDVVVVGSGGLTAAALLAGGLAGAGGGAPRPGRWLRPRLPAEALHLRFGGAPDLRLRAVPTLGGGTVDALLRRLGVRERGAAVPADPFYGAVYPDLRLAVPAGAGFVAAHARLFPREAGAIEALLRLTSRVATELQLHAM